MDEFSTECIKSAWPGVANVLSIIWIYPVRPRIALLYFGTGCLYQARPRVVQDVPVKFITRHACVRDSELKPKAIDREGVVIVFFGEVGQQVQLLQKGGDVTHRKSVAGGDKIGEGYVSQEQRSGNAERRDSGYIVQEKMIK